MARRYGRERDYDPNPRQEREDWERGDRDIPDEYWMDRPSGAIPGGMGWMVPPYGGYGGFLPRGGRHPGDYRDPRDQGRGTGPGYGYGGTGRGRDFFDKAADEVSSWFGDEAAQARRDEDHSGRGPRNYTRSDARIQEDVNDRLTDDPGVDASDIEVTVHEREVTLDGFVSSRRAKRRAEDCADSVTGVTHVQNNLRIQEPSGAAPVGNP